MKFIRKYELDQSFGVTMFAMVTSLLSFFWFYDRGDVLLYKDAISHMEIARRVVDATTPGVGQLGGVWLPLPHVLMLPFIWVDSLYYSGFAGSIISMACYVISAVLVYKIVRDLTERNLAAWIGMLVFALNPNVLYMQATPMTEMLLFAAMLGMVYGVQRWIRTDNFWYLIGAGVASFFATLSRYEAWTLLAVLAVIVLVVAWRRKFGWEKTQAYVLTAGTLAGFGIVMWMGWNLLIFGNPLFFQVGEYAKPSLWVGSGELSLGRWDIAARTYLTAVVLNLWPIVVVTGLCGLVVILVRERLALKTLPVLSMLSFIAFFVLALEKGQRPLHVTPIYEDLYNVRFGLILILPAAILTGYLVSVIKRNTYTEVILATGLACMAFIPLMTAVSEPEAIITLAEPQQDQQKSYDQLSGAASQFMLANYDGQPVLMESFGNELLLFEARIDFDRQIYEGSYQQWEPALENPAGSDVEWIIMRHSSNGDDKVYGRLIDTPALEPYRLVYENDVYLIYRKG